MRYHRLSNEDLEIFRSEFVTFLSSLGIDAPAWEKLKKAEPSKADELVDQFSDMVIHRSLTNISSVRLVSEKEIYVFRFGKENAEVIRVRIEEAAPYDFTDKVTIEGLASGEIEFKSLNPDVEKGSKPVSGNREAEIYSLLSQGAQPCELAFFESFKGMIG